MRRFRQSQANTKLFTTSKRCGGGYTIYGCNENHVRLSNDTLPSTSANVSAPTKDQPLIQEHRESYRFETITKVTVVCFYFLFIIDQQGALALALSTLLFAPYPEWFQRWTILIPLLITMSPFAKLQVVAFFSLVSWLR
jgi:hypothetical protein